MPWSKSTSEQLSLLDAEAEPPRDLGARDKQQPSQHGSAARSTTASIPTATSNDGRPLIVRLDRLYEDPNSPRTEFPESQIDELADDIGQRGILQPIVVHPADAEGCCQVHFGAKRLRAAKRAGLAEVFVVVRDLPADPYAQVAENQKRHGLTPLDLARFIRSKVHEGESNAAIAKQLVMDQTTVAHHLALLELPPDLDDALKSGRCTSPRTLYELSKLHEQQPERVRALIEARSEITRATVTAVRAEQTSGKTRPGSKRTAICLLAQANRDCARLELTLDRVQQVEQELIVADLTALRQRVANLASRTAWGSDSPTLDPSAIVFLGKRDEEEQERDMAG